MSISAKLQRPPVSVRVENLALARGGRVLVEGLSFVAGPGDFVELRGPNGAGKTTLLRAIAGLFRPAAGLVALDGVEEPALAVTYLGHQDGLKPAISSIAHLSYWAGLLGGRVEAGLLTRIGLARAADAPVRMLSQGQRRRLALARLLVAARPVWLLDEPAAALDQGGRALLDELIGAHCAEGGLAFAALHEPLGVAPAQVIALGAAH